MHVDIFSKKDCLRLVIFTQKFVHLFLVYFYPIKSEAVKSYEKVVKMN